MYIVHIFVISFFLNFDSLSDDFIYVGKEISLQFPDVRYQIVYGQNVQYFYIENLIYSFLKIFCDQKYVEPILTTPILSAILLDFQLFCS